MEFLNEWFLLQVKFVYWQYYCLMMHLSIHEDQSIWNTKWEQYKIEKNNIFIDKNV